MIRSERPSRDVRDLMIEAVNSGDLDLLFLAEDVLITEPLIERMIELCQRRPRILLTEGVLEERPIAAVWMAGRSGRYERVGHLEISVCGERVSVTCMPTLVPGVVAAPPPEWEVAEWEDGLIEESKELGRWELPGFGTDARPPQN